MNYFPDLIGFTSALNDNQIKETKYQGSFDLPATVGMEGIPVRRRVDDASAFAVLSISGPSRIIIVPKSPGITDPAEFIFRLITVSNQHSSFRTN